MAEISEISLEPGYLCFRFSGIHEHLRRKDEHSETILKTCQNFECSNVLLDYREVTGIEGFSTFQEHELGNFLPQVLKPNFRIVILVNRPPGESVIKIGKHLENVAVNRGAQLKVAWELDEAVGWLTQLQEE